MSADEGSALPDGPARRTGGRKAQEGRRARRPVGWFYEMGMVTAGNLLLRLRGLILLPLIAAALGAGAFGVWVQLLSVVGLSASLAELNLRTAAVRLLVGELTARQRAERFWSILAGAGVLSVAGAALLWAAAVPAATLLLRDASVAPMFRAGALLIPGTTLNAVQLGLLRGVGEVKLYSILNVLVFGGETVVAVVLLLIWPALLPALIGMAVWRLAVAVVLVANGVRLVGLAPPRAAVLRQAVAYSAPTMPAALARELMDKADRFILGAMMGAAAVGVYSAAYSLSALLLQFVQPIRQAMLPRLGAMWDRGEHDRALRTVQRVSRYFAALAVPAAVGIGVLGGPVLRLVAGEAIAREGGPIVWITAVGALLFGLTMITNQVFFAGHWTWAVAVVFGVGAALNIALNFALIPRWGLYGAAVSTVAAYLVAFCVGWWLARARAGFDPGLALIARVLPPAGVMGVVLVWLPVSTWWGVLLAIPAGALVYAGGLFAFGALLPEERSWVRGRLRRLRGVPDDGPAAVPPGG